MGNASNAYITDKPVQTSMLEMTQAIQDNGFKYRQEARVEDEIKRLAKEREDKKAADLEIKYADMKKVNPIGVKSVDEALVSYITQAQDKRLEFYKKELSGQKLTPEEIVLNKKLQNLPDTLALMVKNYDDTNKQYAEGRKSNSIKADPDYELKMQKMANGFTPLLDADFNPAIGIDKDGDGKPDLYSFDLNEGFQLKPQFVPNVDKNKILNAVSEKLNEVKTTTDSNFTKTTITGLPEADARTAAKGILYTGNGGFTDYTISELHDSGITDPSKATPEILKKIEDEATNGLIIRRPRGKEVDKDYSAMNSAERLRFDKSKEKVDEPKIGEAVAPSKELWGLQHAQIGKGYQSVPVTGKLILNNIPVSNLGGKKGVKGNVSNAQVEDYTFDKSGDLLINVSYEYAKSKDKTSNKTKIGDLTTTTTDNTDFTSTKERASEQIKASRETASKVAKRLGLSLDEMKKAAFNGQTETAAERATRIANGG